MKIRYVNEDDKSDPLSGSIMIDAANLIQLRDERRNGAPFNADLIGDNGFELMIEIAGDLVCVQYIRSDGEPPYLMAVSPRPLTVEAGYVEFLSGGTPTPVAACYIISFDELKQIACHFLNTGGRSDAVSWHEFDPGAAREDARRASRSRNHTE